MNVQKIILHLSLLKDVGAAVINHILEKISLEHLQELYTWSVSDVMHYGQVSEKIAHLIVQGLADKDLLAQEYALLEKHNVNILTLADEAYPSSLRTIHIPPSVLYYQGDALQDSRPAIAFVGARAATAYGKKIIDTFIPPLVEHGYTIVSGGALGIDTFAHETTVKAGGKTIVVLGSGLLHWYPRQNKRLFSTIIEQGGTLLSSFSMNIEPLPGHFPARNRIIAGLSKACVVVQAAQKSGSLITASFALEQGKEVFAVPGEFDNPMSAGCHALFKQGAHVATSACDILQEFGSVDETNLTIYHEQTAQAKIADKVVNAVESDSFLSLCKYPISIDELEQKTNLSLLELQTKLFDLQLQGKVIQNFMGMWQAQ